MPFISHTWVNNRKFDLGLREWSDKQKFSWFGEDNVSGRRRRYLNNPFPIGRESKKIIEGIMYCDIHNYVEEDLYDTIMGLIEKMHFKKKSNVEDILKKHILKNALMSKRDTKSVSHKLSKGCNDDLESDDEEEGHNQKYPNAKYYLALKESERREVMHSSARTIQRNWLKMLDRKMRAYENFNEFITDFETNVNYQFDKLKYSTVQHIVNIFHNIKPNGESANFYNFLRKLYCFLKSNNYIDRDVKIFSITDLSSEIKTLEMSIEESMNTFVNPIDINHEKFRAGKYRQGFIPNIHKYSDSVKSDLFLESQNNTFTHDLFMHGVLDATDFSQVVETLNSGTTFADSEHVIRARMKNCSKNGPVELPEGWNEILNPLKEAIRKYTVRNSDNSLVQELATLQKRKERICSEIEDFYL